MLDTMCFDPKNKDRIKEFKFMQSELIDSIMNNGKLYNIDFKRLLHQYDIFNDF